MKLTGHAFLTLDGNVQGPGAAVSGPGIRVGRLDSLPRQ